MYRDIGDSRHLSRWALQMDTNGPLRRRRVGMHASDAPDGMWRQRRSPSYAVPVRAEKRGRGRPTGSRVDQTQRQFALLDAAERAVRTKGPAVGLVDIAAEAGF